MSLITIYNQKTLLDLTFIRNGEVKAGEVFETLLSEDVHSLTKAKAKYVVLGIPEDIGIRANHGQSGAAKMWKLTLKKLCNIQHNDFFDASQVLILGEIVTDDLMSKAENTSIEELRELTSQLDNRVSEIIEIIVKAGKTPIVIGGGHNNSYAMLKGTSKAMGKPIHCINIDPHADLRKAEGRHSGNGFTYALNENYLDHYFVFGLHENYNSQFILDQFKEKENLNYFSLEEWLKGNIIWEECFESIFEFTGKKPFGFELDLDSISNFPSSAATPTGFSENDIRIMIYHIANHFNTKYFHIAEGAPDLMPEKIELAPKLVAYFITDYIKAKADAS